MLFLTKVLICSICQRLESLTDIIVANSDGLLVVGDIRNLEKYCNIINKVLLNTNFLKSCKTFNIFLKIIQFDILLPNRSDIRSVKKRLLKNALHITYIITLTKEFT